MLDDAALAPLREYRYRSIDKSPLSYWVLNPFWNRCVLLFPRWYAPNLITLSGLGFIVANLLSVLATAPDLVGPGPCWLYYSMAAGLFLYQTFDNCDGKQARRTGSSSPLGELFDHGIDSLNCTLGGLCMVSALALGATKTAVFFTLVSAWPMYFSTWEQAHTGVLYLGYINGPTEGILIACSAMLVSAIYGPGVWQSPVTLSTDTTLGGALLRVLQLVSAEGQLPTWRDLFVLNVLVALFLVHIPGCVYNVHVSRPLGQRSLLSTLALAHQWLPLFVYTAASWAWATSPYGTVLADNHVVLWGLTSCLCFGRMTTEAILAHLLRRPYPLYSVAVLPPLVGAAVVNAPLWLGRRLVRQEAEVYLLYALLAASAALYAHWALHTIGAFCRYLDINCLTIKHAQRSAPSATTPTTAPNAGSSGTGHGTGNDKGVGEDILRESIVRADKRD